MRSGDNENQPGDLPAYQHARTIPHARATQPVAAQESSAKLDLTAPNCRSGPGHSMPGRVGKSPTDLTRRTTRPI